MKEINIIPVERLTGLPIIKKNGIIKFEGGEESIFVWKGRLMRLSCCGGYGKIGTHAIIEDYFTYEIFGRVGKDECHFWQAYCENDRVYVFAAQKNLIWRFGSDDLVNWEESIAIEFPNTFKCHNTAVCKGHHGYVMAIECGGARDDDYPDLHDPDNPYIGIRFTEFFASSPDLENWTLMPFDKAYTKNRYNACPALKYCDGYYYMICLEELPCFRWAPYIYRTADFETWEIGYYNPILSPSYEDYFPKEGVVLTKEQQDNILTHICANNSDLDLCEFEGKTYIVYATGNQGVTGGGSYCEATYNGPLDEFLKANFS